MDDAQTTGKVKEVFLSSKALCREFGFGDRKTLAVNKVDFEFHRGEIISIVGESGSGKTTLAKMVLGLLRPTGGEIFFEGKPRDISTYSKRKLYWQNIQAIFQDPFSTYNIFNRVDSVLLDCIRLQGQGNLSKQEKFRKMKDACSFVNLKFEELANKYPFELSGGQMQRLMIARIFMLCPKLLIADEAILNPKSDYTKRLLGMYRKSTNPGTLPLPRDEPPRCRALNLANGIQI
jgi:peptide/nickel transport system ATP-binding protein